jgi:hypothetical protein
MAVKIVHGLRLRRLREEKRESLIARTGRTGTAFIRESSCGCVSRLNIDSEDRENYLEAAL